MSKKRELKKRLQNLEKEQENLMKIINVNYRTRNNNSIIMELESKLMDVNNSIIELRKQIYCKRL